MTRELPVIARKCGNCTLCCTNLGVLELDKARDEPCKHELPGKGCGIYAERPPTCQAFRCLWLQGIIPVELRPNKTRIVFSTNTHKGLAGEAGEVLVGFVHPRDRGAWKKGPVARWLQRLRTSQIKVIIVCGKEFHFEGSLYGMTLKDFNIQEIGKRAEVI